MKRILAMTAALLICGKCGTINAMPMADFIDPDTRYVHEIMVGCNDDPLRKSRDSRITSFYMQEKSDFRQAY